jgi:hypothetical protein
VSRPRRWAWGPAAVLVAAASVLVTAPGLPFEGAANASGDPITVTVGPTELLGDGQLLTITIKTASDTPVSAARIQLCRDGFAYQPNRGIQPNEDFNTGWNNCPPQPVSTSANLFYDVATVHDNAPTPAGSISKYRVGIGTQTWTSQADDHSAQTISCGPESPCDLVVEVRNGTTGVWNPYVTKLSFKDTDPIAGCGGPATGILVSGGSDRMQDAWIGWTLDHCHQDGQQGAASRAVFNGEGTAVNAFATNKVDFAYTAAGYGDEVALLDAANRDSPRQAIAVPVGLNAAVLAVAGGRISGGGVKLPYEDLRLTQEEVASLLSGGAPTFIPSSALFSRNPELAENFFDTGASAGWLVGAPAEAEANSWFFTQQLLENVPDAWKVPDQALYGSDADRPRGADAALALASPSYAQSLTTLSGRPPLANGVAKVIQRNDTQGGAWVLTDLETATALGMTVVKIANANGDFVPVDQASVTAGVKSMKQTDNGLLLPDPKAVDKVDGVTPDPMAFVEYALVPAEPLVDKDCKARTDSQALLTGWLDYVTGDGQQKLPAGMYPLTPELAQQAQTAIAQVGQAPVTGTCAGQVEIAPPTTTTTPAPTTTTTAAPASTGGTTDGGSTGGTATTGGSTRRAGGSNRSPAVATPSVAPGVAPTVSDGGDKVALATVPAYAGRRSVGWVGTLLALLGLTALSGLAAMAASGRGLPDSLTTRRGRDPDR